MAFFGGSAMKNLIYGGLAGGALGYANEGSMSGALGGAAAGGAFGYFGGGKLGNWLGDEGAKGASWMLGKGSKVFAPTAPKGKEAIKKYIEKQNKAEAMFGGKAIDDTNWKAHWDSENSDTFFRNVSNKLELGQKWMDNPLHKDQITKISQRVGTALSFGAAASIGSSIISSNSGY
jgi:hypothetical protein